MAFNVAADAYDRFMGRYSRHLSPQMADLAGIVPGGTQRALDVGCGPGALTEELVRRLGADAVVAADPSPTFVDAIRARLPGVEAHEAPAESLPFADGSFDASIAQLVVHFMTDPVAGLREMRRVTRPGGVVAACVWDLAGGRAPLSTLWRAARDVFQVADDQSGRAGARAGHLGQLFAAAGLGEIHEVELEMRLEHPTFEDWWEPYEEGVGPAGEFVAGLPADARETLRERCRELLPEPPFETVSVAWSARGTV